MRIKVRDALAAESPLGGITVSGWVRTRRDAQGFSGGERNDGSCRRHLPAVVGHAVRGADALGA
ncbi:MAG: asparagine--tRNA ligase, partial [Verrucomicrobiota bacterium]